MGWWLEALSTKQLTSKQANFRKLFAGYPVGVHPLVLLGQVRGYLVRLSIRPSPLKPSNKKESSARTFEFPIEPV